MTGYRNHQDFPRRRNRIYRSSDGVFLGVCGGIADHFDWSPWIVRIGAIILQFTIAPWLFIAYFVLAFIMKKAPAETFRSYESEEFWNVYQNSRGEALRKVSRAFDQLDKRLQRMENIVTDPGFGLEDEYRNL